MTSKIFCFFYDDDFIGLKECARAFFVDKNQHLKNKTALKWLRGRRDKIALIFIDDFFIKTAHINIDKYHEQNEQF